MTKKTTFFVGWSWFKFNNSGLTVAMVLTFCANVAEGGLIPTFVEVTGGGGGKLVGGLFFHPPHPNPPPPILNRVKDNYVISPYYWAIKLKIWFLLNYLLPITEPRWRWPSVDFLILVSLKISFAFSLHFFLQWTIIFLSLNYDISFPSFSRSDHYFFSDSTMSMPFKSSVSVTCVETDVLLPPFHFLHARRGVLRVPILGSSCVASSSDFFDQSLWV